MGNGKSRIAVEGYLQIYGNSTLTTDNNVFIYYDPFQSNTSSGGAVSVTVGLIVESRAYFKSTAIYVSDERIKINIQDINDDTTLQKILAIQPKTYEYIDKFNKGTNTVYGFISQQIRPIIPEAITLQTDFISNINSILSCSGNVITTNEHTTKLNINDEIKVTKLNNTDETCKVIEKNDNTITVDKDIAGDGDKCFVYGSKVDDFHALDKNYIYTLNVCATQELHRQIQQQNLLIQQQSLLIQDLQNRLSILENK